MTTTVTTRPKRGRPGLEVLPAVPARSPQLALRNRRIRAALHRKRNPLTQMEVAAKYGVSQALVSMIDRNPASGTVAA